MSKPPRDHSTTVDPEVGQAKIEIAELSAASYPNHDDQCDIVMKGGITSGVVYPLTICRLATRYRLRSIGGTSAGAIAAVIAAAAEHRRQRGGPDADEGFRRLALLPTEVSTKLAGLFQPMPSTRGIFGVLFAAIDPEATGTKKALGVVRSIVARKRGWFLAGIALMVAVTLPGLFLTSGFPISGRGWVRLAAGLALPLVVGVAVGIILAVIGLAREAQRLLPDTGFALTDGATHAGEPALTEWLAAQIDGVAGIDDPDRCLTLGDLWGAAAVEAWSQSYAADHVGHGPVWKARKDREVELEVVTTNLTLHRPYRLPFSTQVFLFDEAEMRALFPARVVDTMRVAQSDHLHPDTGEPLWYFPGAGTAAADPDRRPGPNELPLIVMARMSLSFPGLISAVPLYAVDYNGDQSVVRMWFSDGGVSSNFPMHFFDSLLPTRPTFGVNLQPTHPAHPDELVHRPKPTSGGILPRARPFETLPGFVGALLDTMQNWSDNKQLTQRGYADRVVEIRLSAEEGGLNLRMPEARVLKLVARGAEAGRQLLDFDWDAHRLIRYRVAMAQLTDALDRLRVAWERAGGALYPDLLADFPAKGTGSTYVKGSQRTVGDRTLTWREADREATDALVGVLAVWEALGWPAVDAKWPSPSPIVTMVPR